MGQGESCSCIELVLNGSRDNDRLRERLDLLKKGQKFIKSALLGLHQREIILRLAEDSSKLEWQAPKTAWVSEEKGEIDLTEHTKLAAKVHGTSGLQIIDKDSKSVLDITSDDPKIRDQWVIALNELIDDWIQHPENKPKPNLTAAGTSDKVEYFRMREEEIKEREKRAQDLKKKYVSGGMKYTAIAMANRA